MVFEKPLDLLLCLQNLPVLPQTHENILPFEHLVFQDGTFQRFLKLTAWTYCVHCCRLRGTPLASSFIPHRDLCSRECLGS